MFNNIGSKIKSLANILIVCGIVIGGIALFISIIIYFSNCEYLKYLYTDSSILREGAISASNALKGIIYSIIFILISVLSSFPLYGLGQLIENTTRIADSISNNSSSVLVNNLTSNLTSIDETKDIEVNPCEIKSE